MKLFISYSSINRSSIAELADDLSTFGHAVWFDQHISGGEKWWDRIIDNIIDCDVFVIALSPDWVASTPCQIEFNYARQLQKTILPIRVGSFDNYRTIPHDIQELQIVDYFSNDKGSLKRLATVINKLKISPVISNHELPERPAPPISELSKITTLIGNHEISEAEQLQVVSRLASLKQDPLEATGAEQLLIKLQNHPSVVPSVLKQISRILGGDYSMAELKIDSANENRNPDSLSHFLLVNTGTNKRHDLGKTRIIVGRFVSSDIVINDYAFSRVQFILSWEEQLSTYKLIHTSPANPVFLNGQKVSKDEALAVGDIIRCGQTQLQFMTL